MSLKKFILKFWPIIFISVVWLVFSFPYFFQHKVPYPAKYQVTFFSPWSYYQEFAGPVKNNAMPDVIDQIYPWKYFTIQSLKNAQIPLWNPYSFAGSPHMANFQTAVFSPFNLIFLVLPFIDAWSLLVLLQPLLAGLFMYLFIRELEVSKNGALISSIAFMFCGFIVVWMAYGTLSMAITLLPLVLFAIEKYFRKGNKLALLLFAFGLSCSFFSGHIQTSIYLTTLAAFFIIFKLLVTKDVKRFLIVLLIFIIGLGISLIQIIPTLELLNQSVRSNLVVLGGQIPLNYLVTAFAPDFFGNPVTRNDWMGYYAEWASFIGIIPLIFAFFALFYTKKFYVYFFGLMGLLALLFSSDTVFRQLLSVSGLPVFATSIPSRMIVIFSFCFAVLAGFGFDTLFVLIRRKANKKIFFFLGGFTFLLILLWLALLAFHFLPADKLSLGKKNLIIPTIFFLFTVSAVTILYFYKNKKVITILGFIILLFVSFDSLRFASKWMPFDDRKLVYPESAVIKEEKKIIGNGRIFGNIGNQVESYYGLSSLDGYDPLYIKRYGEFIRSSVNGSYLDAERSVVHVDRKGKYTERVLDLLGVNLIFNPKADTFQEWAFPVWANKGKYTLVYEDDKFQLFKNNTALPRAMLFHKYEVINDGKKMLKRFYTDSFDYRNILLLEEDPKIKFNNSSKGNALITSYKSNKVIISVNSDSEGLLFLSDSFYQNWKALVNGKETKIYRADYAFRAVKIPEGVSKVEFIYK